MVVCKDDEDHKAIEARLDKMSVAEFEETHYPPAPVLTTCYGAYSKIEALSHGVIKRMIHEPKTVPQEVWQSIAKAYKHNAPKDAGAENTETDCKKPCEGPEFWQYVY